MAKNGMHEKWWEESILQKGKSKDFPVGTPTCIKALAKTDTLVAQKQQADISRMSPSRLRLHHVQALCSGKESPPPPPESKLLRSSR